MSIWHAPQRARPHYPLAHHVTMSDLAIFAVGMFVAVMVGIAASGMLPL